MAVRYTKAYVEVKVDFRPDGTMYPRCLIWEDGREYAIERVKTVRPASAQKAGGAGDRYTVVIQGQERYIFFEHNIDTCSDHIGKWFVEKPESA